jgi:cell wall-associated NlpC family hydrolase
MLARIRAVNRAFGQKRAFHAALYAVAVLLLLAGCGPPALRFPGPLDSLGVPPEPGDLGSAAERRRPGREPDAARLGERLAKAALEQVGHSRPEMNGVAYRDDCTGLVSAVYAAIGMRLEGSTPALFEKAQAEGVLHKRRRPYPGDVVFFDDTWDRNRNRKFDDPLTHVGIVVAVGDDGTISLVHNGNSGIHVLMMNLEKPDLRVGAGGQRLNDYVRVKKKGDPSEARYLTGQLWSGFASFWKLPLASAPLSLAPMGFFHEDPA